MAYTTIRHDGKLSLTMHLSASVSLNSLLAQDAMMTRKHDVWVSLPILCAYTHVELDSTSVGVCV